MGELIIRHCDNLSKTLQSPKVSAAEAQTVIVMTVKTLQYLRNEDHFKMFGPLYSNKGMICLLLILSYQQEVKLLEDLKLVILKVL